MSSSLSSLAALTGYTWSRYRHDDSPLPIATPYGFSYAGYVGGLYHWNFESWNCAMAPHIQAGAVSPSRAELDGLCKQSQAARIILLLALALVVVTLLVRFWTWRKHNVATRESYPAPACDKLYREHSQDSTVGETRSDVETRSKHAAEVSSNKTGRAELPDDALVKEMMGETGHKELAGENVAIEKPAEKV